MESATVKVSTLTGQGCSWFEIGCGIFAVGNRPIRMSEVRVSWVLSLSQGSSKICSFLNLNETSVKAEKPENNKECQRTNVGQFLTMGLNCHLTFWH